MNYIKIHVTGKNINYFINKMIKQNINIYDLKILNYKEANIKITYQDYLSLIENKTTYQIETIKKYGLISLIDYLKHNSILFLTLILGLVILKFLSTIVFEVEIIHSNKSVIRNVREILEKYDIKKYSFIKNYSQLENIKQEILENNKDTLEWISIDHLGTKYLIYVQTREIIHDNPDNNIYNIIATKSARITRIEVSKGDIIKNINNYISKDDIIVNGYITKPNGELIYTSSKGRIYGEVWYQVKAFYPFIYQEESFTGKSKRLIGIQLLNKRFALFDFNKYLSYSAEDKILLTNQLIPISLIKEYQRELKVTDEYNTVEESSEKAYQKAIETLQNKIGVDSKILRSRIINTNIMDNGVEITVFFSVEELISKYQTVSTYN